MSREVYSSVERDDFERASNENEVYVKAPGSRSVTIKEPAADIDILNETMFMKQRCTLSGAEGEVNVVPKDQFIIY